MASGLLKTRRLAPGTVENHVAELRFLLRTLKRYEFDFSPSRAPNAQ